MAGLDPSALEFTGEYAEALKNYRLTLKINTFVGVVILLLTTIAQAV